MHIIVIISPLGRQE